MKFAYIDESGGDKGDVFVMAGILIDAYKLRKWTAEFDQKLEELRRQHPTEPDDLKASRIINGVGGWQKISPDTRKQFFTDIIDQIDSSAGRVYAFSMSFSRFDTALDNFDSLPNNQNKYWVACSMYISSLVQKKAILKNSSKNLTVLIFDDNERDMPKLSDGLYVCDGWYDDLYALSRNNWKIRPKNRFDQILNTAFAIKSEHSSLIQVADIVSYIYRRHLELYSSPEKYPGEKQLYDDWVNSLEQRREKIGITPPNSEAVEFYKSICHPNWKI